MNIVNFADIILSSGLNDLCVTALHKVLNPFSCFSFVKLMSRCFGTAIWPIVGGKFDFEIFAIVLRKVKFNIDHDIHIFRAAVHISRNGTSQSRSLQSTKFCRHGTSVLREKPLITVLNVFRDSNSDQFSDGLLNEHVYMAWVLSVRQNCKKGHLMNLTQDLCSGLANLYPNNNDYGKISIDR